MVLPKELHVSYTENQQSWLMDLRTFVNFVLEKQGKPTI